jgi:hypothetical protein
VFFVYIFLLILGLGGYSAAPRPPGLSMSAGRPGSRRGGLRAGQKV